MNEAKSKPVIFLAFANERDDGVGYLRNLPEELRRLRSALKPAKDAGLCEVVTRSNCTAAELFEVFQDPQYRNRIGILHYGGHANGYQLLLESASGAAQAAHADGLVAFLAQQHGLQLVFLNGCSTQRQTEALLDTSVPAVVSTSRAIDDNLAMEFATSFYRGLAGGASLRTAFNEARATVQTGVGSNPREAYWEGADEATDGLVMDGWPWDMFVRDGADSADQWNLPDAADAPLFGLPPLPQQDLPESPYRHLNWYSAQDAEVFFGRGREIRDLYDRLNAPRSAPILLLYGQSGVGKSSIMAAGLLPRLQPDYGVLYVRRAEASLTNTLRAALSPDDADVPLRDAWREAEQRAGQPVIVFLDQVEELFTRPLDDAAAKPEAEGNTTGQVQSTVPGELLQLLAALNDIFGDPAQRPRGRLVLIFRKEWLAEIEAQLIEHELPRSRVFLEPLDRRGIVEIIDGPTRAPQLRERYGLSVEDGLANLVADDLLEDRDSAIAPTLQILLTKMWAQAKKDNYEDPSFTRDLYQQLKRDGILLRDFLDQQIAAARKTFPDAVDSGLLLDILARHTTALGTAGQCTLEDLQREYAHLGNVLPDLLALCQDLYLLIVISKHGQDGVKTTRLAHDTLAPLVRERFDESDKPGSRARRILESRAIDWSENQAGAPLDEPDLAVFERGRDGMRAMTADEARLNDASTAARAARRKARTLWRAVGALAVAAVFAFGVLSHRLKVTAELQTAEAEVQTRRADLGAYNARLSTIPKLLVDDTSRASAELENAANFPLDMRDFAWGFYHRLADRTRLTLKGHDQAVSSVSFSPDGKTLASASRDETIRLWDLGTGQTRATLTGHSDRVHSVAFSPDGKTLASASGDNTIRLWDADTEQTRATLTGHTHEINSVAFSPDGKTLASASLDKTIRLWDADTGQTRATLTGHTGWVHSVAFSPGGKTLASASEDNTIRLWDADTGPTDGNVPGEIASVYLMDVSPDSDTL